MLTKRGGSLIGVVTMQFILRRGGAWFLLWWKLVRVGRVYAMAGAAELRASYCYNHAEHSNKNHAWHAGPVLCVPKPSLWLSSSVLHLPASQLNMTTVVLTTPIWSPLSFSPSAIIWRWNRRSHWSVVDFLRKHCTISTSWPGFDLRFRPYSFYCFNIEYIGVTLNSLLSLIRLSQVMPMSERKLSSDQ